MTRQQLSIRQRKLASPVANSPIVPATYLTEHLTATGPDLDIVAVPSGLEQATREQLQAAFDKRVAFQWNRNGDPSVTVAQGIEYLSKQLKVWGISFDPIELGDGVKALFAPLAAVSDDVSELVADVTTLTLTSKQVIVLSLKFTSNAQNTVLPFQPFVQDLLDGSSLGISIAYRP